MNDKLSKLKIGIVCYPTSGGSGVVAVELAHGLARRGHEVHVVSYDLPARLDSLLPGIHFHPVRVPDYPLFEYPPYSLALAAKLAEIILTENLDLLHVHYAIPHAVSGWIARKMAHREDIPLITTLHGTDITIIGQDPSYLPITQYSMEASDVVTVVSGWLGEKVRDEIGCHCEPEIVYNFVDTEVYCPENNGVLQEILYPEIPVLMHMSNFRPVKRICDVVDAYLRIRERVHVQLVLIGDGPERVCAERRLKESTYAADVHLFGTQREAEKLLPGADIFLFPSNAESFGLAALEAMACGVPVVGYCAGGLPEVVKDGVTGYLVETENVDKLVRACIDLLIDSSKLKRMKAAARERAVTGFPVSRALDRYEDIYRRALDSMQASKNERDGK